MRKYILFIGFAFLLLGCGCSSDSGSSFMDYNPDLPTNPTPNPDPDPDPDPNAIYQIPEAVAPYYATIDFKKSSAALQSDLSKLTETKHNHRLTYDGLWEVLQVTDLTPAKNEVYLLYGHKGILQGEKAYTRGKNQHGGRDGQWNREHTYARSLGTPNLQYSNTGANEDAHHIRPADVQWNAKRGNKKFATGSGVSGDVEHGWYPGDEWKGDVARMMLYMYLRYPTQCLPTNVAVGQTNSRDKHMINLLLQWNAEDPVSPIEVQRNDYLSRPDVQGNRNPFIDNPHLATKLWGGPEAENKWALN